MRDNTLVSAVILGGLAVFFISCFYWLFIRRQRWSMLELLVAIIFSSIPCIGFAVLKGFPDQNENTAAAYIGASGVGLMGMFWAFAGAAIGRAYFLQEEESSRSLIVILRIVMGLFALCSAFLGAALLGAIVFYFVPGK